MPKLIAIAAGVAVLSLTGCVRVASAPRGPPRAYARSVECHPSEYWDGHQCRHKGKGHGARKHDH